MTNQTATFIKTYGIAFAFLIAALAAGLAISASAQRDAESLWRANVKSCERVNLIRAESNERIEAHREDIRVLQQFIDAARQARLTSGSKSDEATAKIYKELSDRLSLIKFDQVQITDCKEAFPKP